MRRHPASASTAAMTHAAPMSHGYARSVPESTPWRKAAAKARYDRRCSVSHCVRVRRSRASAAMVTTASSCTLIVPSPIAKAPYDMRKGTTRSMRPTFAYGSMRIAATCTTARGSQRCGRVLDVRRGEGGHAPDREEGHGGGDAAQRDAGGDEGTLVGHGSRGTFPCAPRVRGG